MSKYKCTYISGGGREYDEGIWIIKTKTPKTLIMEKVSENGIYGNYEKGEKIRCQKGNGNPLIEYDDGTFIIYPNQNGTPYYFETISMRYHSNRYKVVDNVKA